MPTTITKITSLRLDPAVGTLTLSVEGRSGHITLSSWDAGLEVISSSGEQISANRLNLNLLDTKASLLPRNVPAALDNFTRNIPDVIRLLAVQINYGQLQALQLLRHSGSMGIDLAHAAPALFWVLAYQIMIGQITLQQAAGLVEGKRLAIARLLDPECSNALVKLLTKVLPQSYCQKELRILHRLSKAPELWKTLRHLPHIILAKLEIIMDSPELVSLPCIQAELADKTTSIYTLRMAKTMYETCFALGQQAGLDNLRHTLANCKNLEELLVMTNNWHERYNIRRKQQKAALQREQEAVEAYERRVQEAKEQAAAQQRAAASARAAKRRQAIEIAYPPPPFTGNDNIVPIRNFSELREEGRCMKNCVATYVDKVLAGQSYFYRVYYPERCTLELRLSPVASIGELKKAENRSPHKSARTYLENWLQSLSKGRST